MSISQIVEGLDPIYTSHDNRVDVFSYEGTSSYNTPIIIKRIRCPDENSLQEACKEYESIQENPHPHICECLGSEVEELPECEHYVYIVMPKLVSSLEKEIECRSIKQTEKNCEYFKESELWEYLRELLSAYAFLQRKNTAHRDIKPQNILIDASGALKVCDFGFAKRIDKEGTALHTLLGTKPYLSPLLRTMLIQGEKNIEKVQHNVFKSDVYSLGMCLAHITALELPDTVTSLKDLELNLNIFLGEMMNKENEHTFSKEWVGILRRMLTKQEEARPDFIQLEMELDKPSEYADDELIKTQIFPMEMQESLNVVMKFGLTYARVSPTQSEEVPCMITLEGLSQHSALRFNPFDILCLIDLSGSMEQERLSLVQTALIQLIDKLGERDRMCLIGFSDAAQRLCPLIVCSDSGKATLRGIIDRLQIGDLTNIVAGLELAMEVIHQRRFKNASVSLLLFSDGKDNCCENAKESCLKALQGKVVDKLSVHCFGLGDDFDEDLLATLAVQGHGVFYHISNPGSIRKAFDVSFSTLTSIIARDISVSVEPISNSEFPCQVTLYSDSFADSFKLPSISSSEVITLMIVFQTPKMRWPGTKRFDPLRVKISYLDSEGVETPKEVNQCLKFSPWTEAKPAQDTAVFANWHRVKGAQCLHEVLTLIDREPLAAQQRLAIGIEELETSQYKEESIVMDMLEDMKEVAENLRTGKDWDSRVGSKK